MDSPLFISIDVGTSKVCTLVAETDEAGDLKIIGVGVEPARGLRRGTVVSVEEASAAIAASVDKAERSSGFEIAQATVSLAGAHVASVNSRGVASVAGTTVDDQDIDRALEAAGAIAVPHNREVVHIVPRGFSLDGQDGIRRPIGMHGYRLEVEAHIVTATTTSIQNLTQCVEAAGVHVESYVLNPLAAAEVVLTETEKEMGVVVCDVGAGTTDLAIYIEGNVWHTTVIPVGGTLVTSDIAHGLRLPADLAEQVKIEHGTARPRDVDAAETFRVRPFGEENMVDIARTDLAYVIEARAEELFGLVVQEIKRSGYDGLLPAGVVLTGGTSQLPGIRQVAADVMNLPCHVAGPGDLRGLVDQIRGPAFSTSVGLLRWAQRESQALAAANRDGRRTRSSNGHRPVLDIAKGMEWLKRLLP